MICRRRTVLLRLALALVVLTVLAVHPSLPAPGARSDREPSAAFDAWGPSDQLSDAARALREDAKAILASRACVRTDAARVAIERVLAERGLRDWSVALAPGLRPDECVTAAISQSDRRVLLLRARPDGLDAVISEIAARLLHDCYDEAGAVALLRMALSAHEQQPFVIRTDGPVGAPPDLWAETVRHVNAGCFVYSGAGWLPDGTPVYYLTGLRP